MNKERVHLTYGALLLICLVMSVADQTTEAKTHRWLVKETEFGTGIKTASSIVQYHDTCVWVQVFFISDQFFKGLQEKETPIGPEFSKNKTLIRTFPDRLMVDFEATVQRCDPRPNEIVPPDYASGLMTGATFEVSWKRGAERRTVPLQFREERHRPGLRWDYFFEVPAKDVPLTDDLLIDVSLRHGTSRTSLSAGLRFPHE